MVLPLFEEAEPGRVLVERGPNGQISHYRDPDTGLFISQHTAVSRFIYDPERGKITDSFGNAVGVGALRLPVSGVRRETETRVQAWTRSEGDIRRFTPGANQQIIERVTLIDRNGHVRTVDISYGLGTKYNRKAQGGKWRYETSKALGLPDNKRVTSSELRGAVAYREFVIQTTSSK